MTSGRAAVETPRGYGAGLRPLGYYATENYTLVAQWATHQINLLFHPPTSSIYGSILKKLHCMPTLTEVPDQ